MNTVFTCMLIALFAVVLAIISSTVKSPCVKYRKKNLMVYLTIALCVVAGAFIFIVHKQVKPCSQGFKPPYCIIVNWRKRGLQTRLHLPLDVALKQCLFIKQ